MTLENPALSIGLLLYPGLTQLDLTGPYEVFSRVPGARVHLLWKTLDPVRSDRGLTMLPTATLREAPVLDLICVPGGPGQVALMDDREVLDFLRAQAETCRYVTSVCTGSLVLGAAGLLRGFRATSHWASRDQLALLGAIPVSDRVVFDGNRITGAGVTSGIDFALSVVGHIAGEAVARSIQLALEYDPSPPFDSGTPDRAGPALTALQREKMKESQAHRRVATELAAVALEQ
ncbi:DJ-1/PfpI family protein [Telmatospirillum sp.]|uniref:DJ-1/PfpI family protein n=1 Tax=Telmatospirillum sp. TaxID=2079197 RepID=UPI00284759DA|nr:DJ-1/PfpI family protein [Telmatospirillum sp.]MDR3435247.1 DJ-1/PfpI family protein [Telmatospirillum sp.]